MSLGDLENLSVDRELSVAVSHMHSCCFLLDGGGGGSNRIILLDSFAAKGKALPSSLLEACLVLGWVPH